MILKKSIAVFIFIFFFLLFSEKNILAQTDHQFEFLSSFPEPTNDVAISEDGQTAFITENGRVKAINISDPGNPTYRGEYNSPNSVFWGLDLLGTRLYASEFGHGVGNNVHIIDVSNPDSLTQLGSPIQIGGPGAALEIKASNNKVYIYVVNGHGGLFISDVSDPENVILYPPFVISGSSFQDLDVVGDVAYIADITGYLKIVDVFNPNTPVLLGSFATGGNPSGITGERNLAYVGTGNAGVKILDVTSPAAVSLEGSFDTDDSAIDIEVVNQFAFVKEITSFK